MVANYCDGYGELSKDFKEMIKEVGEVKTEVSNLKKDVEYLVRREKEKEEEYKEKIKSKKELEAKKKFWFKTTMITISIGFISVIGWVVTNLEAIRRFLKPIWVWILDADL